MQHLRYWTWPSTGMIICKRCIHRHGNSLPHVARLIDEYVVGRLDDRVLREACKCGASPSDLDFILSKTVTDWKMVAKASAKGGHLHVFQWMIGRRDDRGPWKGDFVLGIDAAARHGHLEIIMWLHDRGLSYIGRSAFVDAATYGHLAVLKWVGKHNLDLLACEVHVGMRLASGKGHLATVQWIYKNFKNAVHMAPAMARAANSGYLGMLQWLHQQQSCSDACTTDVVVEAIRGGHLFIVEWLAANCSKGYSSDSVEWAVDAGHLSILLWLHESKSYHFDTGAMDAAALGGHLEMVKWLHTHRSEGCTSDAMDAAASGGHLEVVRWLHENRSEGCSRDAMDEAAAGGHLEIVKWLHENRSEGCTDKAMWNAARSGHLDVLRWLVEHFTNKCRDDLMEDAAWRGHLDVVQYLEENTEQSASAWGLGAASKQGWLSTLQVLMKNTHVAESSQISYERNMVGWGFDEILTQLSSQLPTSTSSLWCEAVESLESFHSCGFHSCVAVMLDQTIRRGYPSLAQRFFGQREASERCNYVAVSAKLWKIVLLRWLLSNGTAIDLSSVFRLATGISPVGYVELEYFEVVDYLSEGDRVQLVCEAVSKKKYRKLLQWTLENTSFNDDSSRSTIGEAIKNAPSKTTQWLHSNLTNARKWCI